MVQWYHSPWFDNMLLIAERYMIMADQQMDNNYADGTFLPRAIIIIMAVAADN